MGVSGNGAGGGLIGGGGCSGGGVTGGRAGGSERGDGMGSLSRASPAKIVWLSAKNASKPG